VFPPILAFAAPGGLPAALPVKAKGPTGPYQSAWSLQLNAVVTLVVADHQQLFAEGLAMILDAEDDFAVVGVAHDGRRAVELAANHRPAVLLLDAHLPDADLGATLTAVRVASPATKVLLLAGDARRETIAAVTACGADGLLAKDRSSRQVANAIRTVVNGQRAMMLATKPPRPSHDPNMELRIGTLSRREREILGLLASGWSNRRIAQERFLSLHTVRTHVQSILVKLGVHSKLEAVAFAYQHGMVATGGPDIWNRHSA
jgi:NarL family two-component system response regulator LiaR